MIGQERNGLRYYQFESFDRQAVDHAMFSRRGGVSSGYYSSLNLGGT